MKKALILFLVATFLISISGCTSRTEYDKLVDEKTALEKKTEELSSKEIELKDEISSRQKEIKSLRDELREAKRKIKSLQKELTKLEKSEAESEEIKSEP